MAGSTKSESRQVMNYLPGTEEAIRTLGGFLPSYIAQPTTDYSQTMSPMEQSMYSGLASMGGGFTTPADNLIGAALLGRLGTDYGMGGYGGGTMPIDLSQFERYISPTPLSQVAEPQSVTTQLNIPETMAKAEIPSFADWGGKKLYGLGPLSVGSNRYGVPTTDPRIWGMEDIRTALGTLEKYTAPEHETGEMMAPRGLGRLAPYQDVMQDYLTHVQKQKEKQSMYQDILDALQGPVTQTVSAKDYYGTEPTTDVGGASLGGLVGEPVEGLVNTDPLTLLLQPQSGVATPGQNNLLSQMFSTYQNLYENVEKQAQKDLEESLYGFRQDLAARGRIGSGAHIEGAVDKAQEVAEKLSGVQSQLGEQFLTQARGLGQYEAGTQQTMASALSSLFGGDALTGKIQSGLALGSTPRTVEQGTTQANIQDLLYRIGLGAQLGKGFGSGYASTSTATEPSTLGRSMAKGLSPAFVGLSAYLNKD